MVVLSSNAVCQLNTLLVKMTHLFVKLHVLLGSISLQLPWIALNSRIRFMYICAHPSLIKFMLFRVVVKRSKRLINAIQNTFSIVCIPSAYIFANIFFNTITICAESELTNEWTNTESEQESEQRERPINEFICFRSERTNKQHHRITATADIGAAHIERIHIKLFRTIHTVRACVCVCTAFSQNLKIVMVLIMHPIFDQNKSIRPQMFSEGGAIARFIQTFSSFYIYVFVYIDT